MQLASNRRPIWKLCRGAFALLIVAAVVQSAWACINMHATDLHGGHKVAPMGAETYSGSLAWQDRTKRNEVMLLFAEERMQSDNSIENRSDYAAALIYSGCLDEAIKLLNTLEQEASGDYSIAANLGTAYELAGENQLALKWTEEAITRSPDSHLGSEWIHVEILRAKVAWDAGEERKVLNLNFGLEPLPAELNLDRWKAHANTLEELRDQIFFQLTERTDFVPPKDAVVAELLFALANCVATTETIEEALPVYDLAEEYGYSNTALLRARRTHLENITEQNSLSGKHATISIGRVIAIGVVLIGLAFGVVVGVPASIWLLWKRFRT